MSKLFFQVVCLDAPVNLPSVIDFYCKCTRSLERLCVVAKQISDL